MPAQTDKPTFQIEKGIPVPETRGRGLYPFADMGVGDSFFVGGEVSARSNALTAALNFGKRNGLKFSSRNVDGGLRIWRVA